MGIFDKFLGPARRSRFASLIAAELHKAGATATFRYDASEFRLVASGDEFHHVNLGNTYREFLDAPRAERRQITARFVRSWVEGRKALPAEFGDAAHDLLPAVRSRSFFESLRLQIQAQGGKDLDWPHHVIADHFGASLVYDLPNSMSQIQGHQLTSWGVGFDEAMEVALDNLSQISGQGLEPIAPGVWRSPWRDNYDASRLLLTDLIEGHEVEGDPVVAVPNRDTLLLTGSGDEAGLAVMAAAAEEAAEHPRPIHAIPVRLSYGSWSPFLPPEEHPSHQHFKLMWVRSVGQDYGDQAGLLNALHEKTGEDIFVGSYSAARNEETGLITSYCVWGKGVDTLLPRTDVIHFFDPDRPEGDKIAGSGSWERVAEVVGGLMEEMDTYPERYRVRAFPTDEQVRAIVANR